MNVNSIDKGTTGLASVHRADSSGAILIGPIVSGQSHHAFLIFERLPMDAGEGVGVGSKSSLAR
jgi:hypothetical protein